LLFFVDNNGGLCRAGRFKQILEKKELVVGTSGGFPTFSYIGKDGKAHGSDIDLARNFASWLGMECKIQIMPFNRLINACLKGEIDMIVSCMSMTGERNTRLAYIGPYYISGQSVLTGKSLAIKFDPYWAKNPEIRLAVQRGTTSEKFAENETKADRKSKVDGIMTDYPTAFVLLIRNPMLHITSTNSLNEEPIGIGVRPTDPLLLNALENYRRIFDNNIRNNINQYFNNPDWIKDLS
jgi:polar amino acid transport system substrate-binding protein